MNGDEIKNFVLKFDEIREFLLVLIERLKKVSNQQTSKQELLSAFDEKLDEESVYLLNQISQAIALNQGGQVDLSAVTEEITALSAGMQTLHSNLEEVHAYIATAVQNLPGPMANTQEEIPYNPKPDTVYVTNSELQIHRNYIVTGIELCINREYFVLDNNAPAILQVDFDLTLPQAIQNLALDIFVNEQSLLTESLTLSTGEHHIQRFVSFEMLTTNSNVYFRLLSSDSTNTMEVSNIRYKLVGDNAQFLKERAQDRYSIKNLNNDMYVVRERDGIIDFKKTSALNPDFAQNFTTLISYGANQEVLPMFLCYFPSGVSNVPTVYGLGYVAIDYSLKTLDYYTFEDGEYVKKLARNINANTATVSNLSVGMMIATNYSSKQILLFDEVNKYKIIKITKNAISIAEGNLNTCYDKYLQVVTCNLGMIKRGLSDSSNMMISQNRKGEWMYTPNDGLSSQCLESLGFGTRVDISQTPPPRTSTKTSKCFRIFMKVYDHWVVKYFYISSNKIKFYKAEEMQGDFDQILNGEGSKYFTIKNGVINTFVDNYLWSLEELA